MYRCARHRLAGSIKQRPDPGVVSESRATKREQENEKNRGPGQQTSGHEISAPSIAKNFRGIGSGAGRARKKIMLDIFRYGNILASWQEQPQPPTLSTP